MILKLIYIKAKMIPFKKPLDKIPFLGILDTNRVVITNRLP